MPPSLHPSHRLSFLPASLPSSLLPSLPFVFSKRIACYVLLIVIFCLQPCYTFFSSVAPVITGTPLNRTVVSPESVNFTCVATARPRPSIAWWRVEENGTLTEIVAVSGTYGIWEDEDGERVLTSKLEVIETEPSDALTYICVADNMAGIDQAMAELTVHGMCMCVGSPEVEISDHLCTSFPTSCACDHLPHWRLHLPSERDLSCHV